MSELSGESVGCFPPNTYSTLVTSIFSGISLVGILFVIVVGSLVAYKQTQTKILQAQMKYSIELRSKSPSSKQTTSKEKNNNSIIVVEDNGNNVSNEEKKTDSVKEDEKQFDADIDVDNMGNYKFQCMKWFLFALPKAILQKKRCYLPSITHTIDQATDIGAIIQFYQIYKYEYENNIDCNGINGGYLFWNSLFAFCFYRIISSLWIYNLTGGKILDTVLQIFDLKFYHALYINFERNNVDPNSPQRYLMLLEATLESFPQCIVQLFYFIKVGNSNSGDGFSSANVIVLISLITSILNVSSKMITEDKIYFFAKWRNIDLTYSPFYVNYRYIIRFIVRAIDFINRVIFIILIWIILGGMILYIYLFCEFTFLIIIAAISKRFVLISNCFFFSVIFSFCCCHNLHIKI